MSLRLGLQIDGTIVTSDGSTVTDASEINLVNDLPGFSVLVLANAASSDIMTATENFQKLTRAAIKVLKNNFFSALGRYVNIINFYDLETEKVSGTVTSGEGYISFDKYNLDPFVKFKVKSLVVKFCTYTTIYVNIVDGSTITPKSFDVVPGFNTLEIDYTFQSNDGRVYFDTGDNEIWETGNFFNRDNFLCNSGCGNYGIEGNIGYIAMCVVDKDAIIDLFSDQLNYSLWWQFGIRGSEEFVNTERVTWLMDMKKEQAVTNMLHWNKPYDPITKEVGEYPSSLYLVVQNAKMQVKLNDYVLPVGNRIVNVTP